MPDRKPILLSAAATLLLMLVIGVLSALVQMLALNGAGESRAMTALGLALLCQGAGGILAAALAGWLTRQLIGRFAWPRALAVAAAVSMATLLGAGLAFLALIASIPLAGIR
jgi:asparagine N-glycosylation enzyme membrane subunit Stt3